MNINSLSVLDKTVKRMLGELLEREVTRDDPEWAAAMASLTVSEKLRLSYQDVNTRKTKGIVVQ